MTQNIMQILERKRLLEIREKSFDKITVKDALRLVEEIRRQNKIGAVTTYGYPELDDDLKQIADALINTMTP